MTDFIQFAVALNGTEAGAELHGSDIARLVDADDLAWVHLRGDHDGSRKWIAENLSYLDHHAIDALLADETRPRATEIGDGALVILRGVNHNAGADPDDMVSVRLWIDANRIVSVSRRRLKSVDELKVRILAGKGPADSGDFLCALIDLLTSRIETYRHDLDDATDDLEETVIATPGPPQRLPILDLRQQTIIFRRYIAPQRDEIGQLQRAPFGWLDEEDRRRLHESHNNLIRIVEDLDAIRDRLQILKEELTSIMNDRLNKNMYILSVITALFLPLGFLTGLFGVNLAGMPGASNSVAFIGFVVALALIGGLQLLIFRWLKWF